MAELDPKHLALLIGKREPSVFRDYIERVANGEGLLKYKTILQYGKKAGESLYTHVLNGILVLEQLRPALKLTQMETRVLFTAFTIHDLNKLQESHVSYRQIMTPENARTEIEALGLDAFFPAYDAYLEDIVALGLAHSAHYHHDGASLIRSHDPYGLGRERVDELKHLMRAADAIDLSHTLDERNVKADFLFHLNTFSDIQYEFCTHQVTEDRGLLSNIVHESIVTYLRDVHDLIPLLFYPDGVAYLIAKGRDLAFTEDDVAQIGQRIADTISEMTSQSLVDFVESKPGGIKIMPKCFDLGLPFERIWRVVYGKVQTRNLRTDAIAEKTRGRAERDFAKHAKAVPGVADTVRALLDADEPLTAMDEATLRLGELVRAYYIFVKEYFPKLADDPWEYVYDLLALPEERWPVYEYFHQLWDRAYVIARDLAYTEEALTRRFAEDGARLLAETGGEDPKVALFTAYVKRYVVFSFGAETSPAFREHLTHYMENQHKQCVMCSSLVPTSDWMSGDVRDDITVQAFSNRLRGGPGDPKKQVCDLCRIQFLLEKLNYPPVRGEKMMYMHLFPYSFLTAPFIQGLRVSIQRLVQEDIVERALFLRSEQAVRALGEGQPLRLDFTALTQAGKSQYYGLYLPRYSATVGNRIIFPMNPAGSNDTERLLFALWNAMLLQKHFGCKVLLTESPVASLGKEDFHDLYVANASLAARGLIRQNDYAAYQDGTQKPGTLAELWGQVHNLFALYRLVRSADTRRNELVAVVHAVGNAPLDVFYTVEKLMEARVSDREWPLIRLSQRAFPYVEALSQSIGGGRMRKLSESLRKLARIAWEGGLRGRSLKKNSLMTALDEVFKKLSHHSEAADMETLRAATVEDIFEHLERIADEYRPGRKKWEATQAFVDCFYDDIYQGVYGGKLQKLLADEKMLRSAYMFYIREAIPRKQDTEED